MANSHATFKVAEVQRHWIPDHPSPCGRGRSRNYSMVEPAPALYRIAARLMFAPFGGLATLRDRALDTIGLRPGSRVLELGCGPGDFTAAMTARGAVVHGVDASPAMLRVARRRVPSASFEQADVLAFKPRQKYDVILMAFLLHELPPADVPGVVASVSAGLAPDGSVAILDHSLPSGRSGRTWHALLRVIEPAHIDAWLAIDPAAMCRSAGLVPREERFLAGGRARLVTARIRTPSGQSSATRF
jgi:ubiquinone/menaquinone biosynthesis C-methylase UbiE